MNESRNPFAEPNRPSKQGHSGRAGLIGIALVAIAAAILGGLAFRRKAQEIEQVRRELGDARTGATQSQSEASDLRDKLTGSDARISELNGKLTRAQTRLTELETQLGGSQAKITVLESEKESADQARKGLEDQLRGELQSKDVAISRLQGKLTVNILDRILFDSGEAVLKQGGETVLRKIAAILDQHPSLKIHVIGHTDNVPIRPNSRSRFPSNWELSTARALAAVRFLTERAGVDPRRLGAVGYGEFRPLADNTTAEGRAQNRRIAITILGDELVGADTVPGASTNLPAASSPSGPKPADAKPDQP
jgi:chemotaxis protein MotB